MATAQLGQLYSMKNRKLKEQTAVSNQMNDILCKKGGVNEQSRLTQKNLRAAIAVSKQSGYFEYYSAPDDVKQIEHKRVLSSLAKEITRLHGELVQLNDEIVRAEIAAAKPALQVPHELSSLSAWYEKYGRPKITDEKKELMTKFEKTSKVYGGTKHYSSFKTVSTFMVKGRLTR